MPFLVSIRTALHPVASKALFGPSSHLEAQILNNLHLSKQILTTKVCKIVFLKKVKRKLAKEKLFCVSTLSSGFEKHIVKWAELDAPEPVLWAQTAWLHTVPRSRPNSLDRIQSWASNKVEIGTSHGL